MDATEQFFDDFSNAELSRYYEITPGVGTIVRRPGGLQYDISRAPDGSSEASDYLTIDYLGRPHSPAARAAVRFAGTRWALDVCVEYDFPTGRNGRQAFLWLVQGDAGERYHESVVLVRDADLDRNSLRLVVHDPEDETAESRPVPIPLHTADRYRFRVERAERLVIVSWSDYEGAFCELHRQPIRSASEAHCLVLNGASFAGGASFVIRSLKLAGVRPDPPPQTAVAGARRTGSLVGRCPECRAGRPGRRPALMRHPGTAWAGRGRGGERDVVHRLSVRRGRAIERRPHWTAANGGL
jgi:hypothetical protein